MFFYQPNLAEQTTTEIITYFFGMIYSGQGYAVRIFVMLFVVSFCFVYGLLFDYYCLYKFSGQFSTRRVLLKNWNCFCIWVCG